MLGFSLKCCNYEIFIWVVFSWYTYVRFDHYGALRSNDLLKLRVLLLVEHLFKRNPLQYLLSSLNAVISTNERHWIITGHVTLVSSITENPHSRCRGQLCNYQKKPNIKCYSTPSIDEGTQVETISVSSSFPAHLRTPVQLKFWPMKSQH